MLAALAISTHIWWLQALGYCGWAYLVFLHLHMLWNYTGLGMELLPSYVSVLILKPSISQKQKAVNISKYQQFWGFIYKKTTPDQQLMLLMEDGPQALLAGAMALGGQLGKFTALVNLILPSIRLLLAWLLHESIARSSMDWLLYDAWRTEAAGQALICEQRLTGLAQRKGTLRFTAELWRAVLEDLNLDPAGTNSQFDQSYTMPKIGPKTAPLSKFLVSLALADADLWSDLNHSELSLLQLQHVNLRSADLGDVCIVALAKSLAHNMSLKVLELPFNHIGNQGALALAKALESNRHLTVLNLGDNHIGAVGASALAKGLVVNNVLEKLYLNENRDDWIEEGCNAWDAWASALEINTTLTLYLSTLPPTHPGAPDALEILEPFVEQGRVTIMTTEEFDRLNLGNLT